MKLKQLVSFLDSIAPPHLAEPWDNVGLLAGDPEQPVRGVHVAFALTGDVIAAAASAGCDVIVSYHPPVLQPIRKLTAPSPLFAAVRRRMAVYSPHTAWDAADGGASDVLADILGLVRRRPLRPRAAGPCCKLVVFVPPDAADRVAAALFAAGAGRIGNYSCCSFRSPGVGTFFGEQGARPAVGQAMRPERVDELRLETILPVERIDAAIAAIRASHPYEEPAFDLIQLHSPPGGGMGRIGDLPEPMSRRKLLKHIAHAMDTEDLLLAGPASGVVGRCACAAGPSDDLIDDAIARGAEFFLTGEVRYPAALRAAEAGMTVAAVLGAVSEKPIVWRLRERLMAAFPDLLVDCMGSGWPLELAHVARRPGKKAP